MLIIRSGLTVRCARCRREVKGFVAAYAPECAAWRVTAYCHGDSAAVTVPDGAGEATAFRPVRARGKTRHEQAGVPA
jgi:hypothetical protein